MANGTGTRDAQFKILQVIAAAMFIGPPIIYLVIVFTVAAKIKAPEPQAMLLYLLLAIAALQLIFARIVTTAMIKGTQKASTQANPVTTIWIVKMAMVESIFIFGLVYCFITADTMPIYYFYAVGVAGILMHWPTRERFDSIADQLEAK